MASGQYEFGKATSTRELVDSLMEFGLALNGRDQRFHEKLVIMNEIMRNGIIISGAVYHEGNPVAKLTELRNLGMDVQNGRGVLTRESATDLRSALTTVSTTERFQRFMAAADGQNGPQKFLEQILPITLKLAERRIVSDELAIAIVAALNESTDKDKNILQEVTAEQAKITINTLRTTAPRLIEATATRYTDRVLHMYDEITQRNLPRLRRIYSLPTFRPNIGQVNTSTT